MNRATSNPRLFHAIMTIAALSLLITPTLAQSSSSNDDEVSVEVELSRSSVYVGDELAYRVIVRGALDPEVPEVAFPNLVNAQFNGRSSQSFTSVRIINGVRQTVTERSYIFQYTLTAMTEGLVEIPAPTVLIDGRSVRGEPASFQSLLPQRSDVDHMEISIDRTRVYLNETVSVECVWWIAENTSEFNLASSSIPDSFEITPRTPSTGGQFKIDFSLDGKSMTGFVERGTHNGREMSRFTFRFSITPAELGRFELGPMRSIFTRHSGAGSRFRAYIESNSIPIEVVPVPEEGRPDGYEGAIGSYQLVARASNNSVNVGDPIKLTLRIRGDEPMVGVREAPDLNDIPAFREQFKIESEGWREVTPRNPGTRLYEITIRALSDSVNEIPPIELPSFDPSSERFTIYKSEPIPLDVTAVEEITIDDAVINNTSTSSPPVRSPESVERIELSPVAPGLWAHGSADDLLVSPSFSLARVISSPIWQTALIAPPAIFGLSWVIGGFIRARDPDRTQLKRAYAAARRRSGAESLKLYISHLLHIDLDAVSASDARSLRIDPQLQSELYDLLIRSESKHADTPDDSVYRQTLQDVHAQHLSQLKEAAA